MDSKAYRHLNFLPAWLPTFIVTVAIIWLTLGHFEQSPDAPRLWEHTDKAVHFLMFGFWFFIVDFDWYRSHPQIRPITVSRITVLIALAAIAFGGIIEIIQPYFDRTADFADFIADSAGVAAAFVFSGPVIRYFRRH